MTAFQVADRVRRSGAADVLVVLAVHKMATPFGTFVTYECEPEAGGEPVVVNNGHLVLEAVPPAPAYAFPIGGGVAYACETCRRATLAEPLDSLVGRPDFTPVDLADLPAGDEICEGCEKPLAGVRP